MIEFIERTLRQRSHYRATFESSESAKFVLADLRRFCKPMESPLVVSATRQQVDPVATGVRIGRQEVFQRIATMLNMDDAQLLKLKEEANHD